jgi:hypothetical protein
MLTIVSEEPATFPRNLHPEGNDPGFLRTWLHGVTSQKAAVLFVILHILLLSPSYEYVNINLYYC